MKHPQRLYSRILTIIRYQLLSLSLSLPLSSPFHPLNSPSSFSHDTPRTELPASARFDLKERGEQVEETEKRMEKGWKGWRRKTDGQRRRFHEDQWDPEPDSKLEKICSEFLDWDPPEIALSLDPSTHTPSLSLSLSICLFLSLFQAHLVLVARLTWNADKRYLYPLAPPRIFDLSFRFDFGIPPAKHLRLQRKFPRSHSNK